MRLFQQYMRLNLKPVSKLERLHELPWKCFDGRRQKKLSRMFRRSEKIFLRA